MDCQVTNGDKITISPSKNGNGEFITMPKECADGKVKCVVVPKTSVPNCLELSDDLVGATQVVKLDEAVLDDNADMLVALYALDDPKVQEIIVPHIRRQVELLEEAERVKARYRRGGE